LSGGSTLSGELGQSLAKLGWTEGRNVRFEIRPAPPGAPPAVLAAAVADLVGARVDVLVGWTDRADALAAATRTIPIVAGIHPDPVGLGLARSLREPGGNVTGLSAGTRESASAWLGILRTLRPRFKRLAIVHGARGEARMRVVTKGWVDVAAPVGVTFSYAPCATLADVGRSFDALGDPASAAAFLLFGGMSTVALPGEIQKDVHELAIRRRIATIGEAREGALVSYDASHSDPMGRVASMIDKILRGANPAQIPFQLPDRTEFVVNRATARAIGVELPPEILLRATEVVG
jgi:putative ABC transport system substrate-binding protein